MISHGVELPFGIVTSTFLTMLLHCSVKMILRGMVWDMFGCGLLSIVPNGCNARSIPSNSDHSTLKPQTTDQ